MTEPSVPDSFASSESSRPEQPVAVPVDAADDVGRQRAAGVLADILAFGADLGELRDDRVGDRGVDGAGQVDERLVAAAAS